MIFTDEQLTIINSDKKDFVVNAGPGMGKTTLLLGIVENHSKEEKEKISQILCFNKMIKDEINRKVMRMNKGGLVGVNTFHSLAFNYMNEAYIPNFRNRVGGSLDYFFVKKTMELIRQDVKLNDDDLATLTKVLLEFCKSNLSMKKFLKNDFFKKEPKFESYFTSMVTEIPKYDNIKIPHEYYIKFFQMELANKVSNLGEIDYLLVDEFQDVSPCYLSIIKYIRPNKVVKVGDTLQKIYGYNGAIGIGEFDYKLSQSFRIGSDNANFCNKIVKLFTDDENLFIKGVNQKQLIGEIPEDKNKVIIFRTNKSLIQRLLSEVDKGKICAVPESLKDDIINSYTIINNMNLYGYYNYKGVRIRNENDLKKYIKLTNDSTLKFVFAIFTKYKNRKEAEEKVKELRNKVSIDLTRTDINVLITAHKCKGMEFPYVELSNDFPTIEEIQQMREKGKPYLDELCILYVALTRSNNILQLNDNLKNFYNNGGEL